LPNFCDVKIEKVAVKHSLHAAGDDGNEVEESLEVIPVDPVQDVQCAVRTQGKQVVRRDALGLSSLAYHEQLWQNSNSLEVNREGPQDLQGRKIVIYQERKASNWNHNELDAEAVVVVVICSLELGVDEIYGTHGCHNENDLHGSVIKRDKVCDQVEITGNENHSKHDLGFSRHTSA